MREGIKVGFFIQATHMGVAIRESSCHLTLPVLAMWGGNDRVALGGDEKLRGDYDRFMKSKLAGGHATHFYRAAANLRANDGLQSRLLRSLVKRQRAVQIRVGDGERRELAPRRRFNNGRNRERRIKE